MSSGAYSFHTPQLSPIEILWRDLKRVLASSYFDSIDEPKAAIMDIVNNGELDPPKLMKYVIPESAELPTRIVGADCMRNPICVWPEAAS